MSNLVSVCMIVKNEEEVLSRCLNAIAGLWDELIIVDTGSTDRTVEIAQSYGAMVLHYEWVAPGNKGAARNLGIEAATGKWIVIVDADEVVCEPLAIRAMLQDCQAPKVQVLFHNYINGEINLSWRQVRIFQRGACAYKYREHEIPVDLSPNLAEAATDFVFQHRAPDGRATGKSAPMLARLAMDVDENPNDPHSLYFYHRECLIQGLDEQSIELGQQYLDLTANGGYIQSEVYGNRAIAYQRMGNINEARKSLHMAAACEPMNREWIYRLGLLHTDCKEWNIALAMLRAAAEILPNQSRQWEPTTTARIYQLIEYCQHELAHSLAHSHSH